MTERVETYTKSLNRRYVFICEMTWGCVPIQSEKFDGIKWAMDTDLYKRTEQLLEEGFYDEILSKEPYSRAIRKA